jgi:hypothetical protein
MKTRQHIIYRGTLSGLSHHDYARFAKLITAGQELQLRRDSGNLFDTNAIAIDLEFEDDTVVQIGWIRKEDNAIMAKLLDAGCHLSAYVISHEMNRDLTGRLYVGVYIHVAEE